MKNCCRPDPEPGPFKRILNTLTTMVLIVLALVALWAVVAG